MIPTYLQGKSAIEICNSMRYRVFKGHSVDTPKFDTYIQELEMLLVLAVKDALCNADEVKELIVEGEYRAMGRAIAFLNMVLPYEEKKNV